MLTFRRRFPDAVQRETVHRWSGIVGICEVPGSAAHHFVLRCARETSPAMRNQEAFSRRIRLTSFRPSERCEREPESITTKAAEKFLTKP